jgi:hypothetical protein
MTSKQYKNHAIKALKAIQKDEPVPGPVFLPPALRGTPGVVHVFTTDVPDIKDNIARIYNEADPIGMLIAIATGMPVATHKIDPAGKLHTVYETLPLNSPIRERVIRHLADKVMPRMSTTQKTTKENDDGSTTEWEATLSNAAARDEAD